MTIFQNIKVTNAYSCNLILILRDPVHCYFEFMMLVCCWVVCNVSAEMAAQSTSMRREWRLLCSTRHLKGSFNSCQSFCRDGVLEAFWPWGPSPWPWPWPRTSCPWPCPWSRKTCTWSWSFSPDVPSFMYVHYIKTGWYGMLIVSCGYYSLTYLFSYLLISRRCRMPTQSVLGLEGQVLGLGLGLGGQVLGLGFEGCGLDSKSVVLWKSILTWWEMLTLFWYKTVHSFWSQRSIIDYFILQVFICFKYF